jgi:hypothetical protein
VDIKPAGGPEIPFDNSFADVASRFGSASSRDVPPVHPADNLSYVSDQEVQDYVDKKTSRNLFTVGKYRCCAAVFTLNKQDDLDAYELIMNNSLQKGWIIAIEERNWSKDGSTLICFLKYLIPEERPGVAKNPIPSP